MTGDTYRTVARAVDTELEISRSRFLTHLARVDSEPAARAVIAEIRHAHPRARHHCTAFVIGPECRLQRSSDDGEPSGTAGAPMLDALLAAELSDVVAVVTRYFGGVLLGAGGLTRAYRAAVAEAVRVAPLQLRRRLTPVTLGLGYDAAAPVEAEARRRGYRVGEAQYDARVTQRYWVADDEVDALIALAQEVTSGGAEVSRADPEFIDVGAAAGGPAAVGGDC